MIIGIGSDILDIRRVEKAVENHPQRFAEKLLSETEIAQWQKLPEHKSINYLAKRWAAKEALGKACGTGIRTPVLFPNITLGRDSLGKPQITAHHELHDWFCEKNITHVHVTLSDESPYCVAFVVLETDGLKKPI